MSLKIKSLYKDFDEEITKCYFSHVKDRTEVENKNIVGLSLFLSFLLSQALYYSLSHLTIEKEHTNNNVMTQTDRGGTEGENENPFFLPICLPYLPMKERKGENIQQ